ncbi:hypothetical protein AB4Z54_10255 [Streptomyces sp. MCAF7]
MSPGRVWSGSKGPGEPPQDGAKGRASYRAISSKVAGALPAVRALSPAADAAYVTDTRRTSPR